MRQQGSQTTARRWLRQLGRPAPPSHADRPFRVVGWTRTAVDSALVGVRRKLALWQYDLKVPYRTIWRRAGTADARMFLPQDAKEPMPLIVSMHYEMGLESAAEYLAQGWAVLTPRQSLNPFADGVNLNLALLSAGRRMPFVDQQRVAIVGGSAGGYMTLMVASQSFPLAAAAAVAPIVSIPYEVAYFAHNAAPARGGAENAADAPVPVFSSLVEAVRGFAVFLGPLHVGWRNWMRNSPVGVMERITCPTVITFSTADVLVPTNQVGDRFVRAAPKAAFPRGFTFDRRALVSQPKARTTLLQAVSRRAEVFRIEVPASLPPSWQEADPARQSPAGELPCVFSRGKPLSVVILDEGPPDARIGHFKYRFRHSMVPFFKDRFRRKAPLAPGQLTALKLEMLMRRFRGEDFEGLMGYQKLGAAAAPLSRRNRLVREKIDVIAGLSVYCQSGAANRKRLQALYRELPAPLRALDVGPVRFDADLAGGLAHHKFRLNMATIHALDFE